MTIAAALVVELEARGVALRRDGETVKLRPVGKVTREELEILRRHRAEVLALLHDRAITPELFTLWPAALPDHGARQVGPFGRCALCATGTWIEYGRTPFCLECTAEVSRAAHARTLGDLLTAAFGAGVSGASPDLATFTVSEITRLVDECGPKLAARITRNIAREWYLAHRVCPWCAEPDVFHDPHEEAT